jgi:hypothetical protein
MKSLNENILDNKKERVIKDTISIGAKVLIQIKDLEFFNVTPNLYSDATENAIKETIPFLQKYRNKFFNSIEIQGFDKENILYLVDLEELNKFGNPRFYLDKNWVNIKEGEIINENTKSIS